MDTDSTVDEGALQYLFTHIFDKGIEAGSILGTFIATPIAAVLHKRRGGLLDADFTPKAMRAITTTTLTVTTLSLIAGLGLVGGKEGFDQEKITDRAYRLRHNQQQTRCDNFAYSGSAGGAALSCLRGFPHWRTLFGVSFVGNAAGVLLHVATSQEDEKGKVEAVKGSVQNMAKELS